MDKNYIKIINENGEEINCELILKYYDKTNNKNYIVYKKYDEYYAARFNDVLGRDALDTDLSDDEINKLNEILSNKDGGI